MKTLKCVLAGMMMATWVLSSQAASPMPSETRTSSNPSAAVDYLNPKNMSQTTTTTAVAEPAKATGNHYYVSRNTGRGRIASKEQPAKDLGNIIAKLQPGDVIHVAEGIYTSRGDQGADEINVPVSIIGGYSPDFSKRDPWGAHKTVLTGTNHIDGLTTPRIYIKTHLKHRTWVGDIVIDGVIVDNGLRNRYKDEKELCILRKANPAKEVNASPGSAGIKVLVGKETNVTVRNCIVMNTAPMEGALSVQGNQNSKILIENNIVVNNTGNGIQCLSAWHARPGNGLPSFRVLSNTVLFTWKPDAIASNSGNALSMDTAIELFAEGNTFGFSDRGEVDNIKKCQTITLKDNLITASKKFDYREFNTKMTIEEIEDESDFMSYESTGNITKAIQVPVSSEWANVYASRKEISRAQVDAQAKAHNNDANALRRMLGLNLRANSVSLDAEIWLHRMSIEDALKVGMQAYEGRYGASNPGEIIQ